MKKYSSHPYELIHSLIGNRQLISNLVHREVIGRYRGSMLGVLWSLITPAFMLLIYTFVFGVVFKARWNVESDSKIEFALVLYSGLLVFNIFSECITRAPSLILSNSNYVKKVIFPLEILPWVTLGGAIFNFIVGFLIWVVAYVVLVGIPPRTIMLVPIMLVPFSLFVMGLSWFLASVGVYLRDISQVIGLLVQVLMFATPIFYPLSALSEKIQAIIILNPLAIPVEMMRDMMYWGNVSNSQSWIILTTISIVFCLAGFACFQKIRKGFADVL